MYLKNYIAGQWQVGTGLKTELYDALNRTPIAIAAAPESKLGDAFTYGREQNKNLRHMTFQQRGLKLKALAYYLSKLKAKYYGLSCKTGASKTDSWMDIEGGISYLFAYASLRKKLGDQTFYLEGDNVPLSQDGSFMGHHILVPRVGVALHINAFNFPVANLLGKFAMSFLAGVPAIIKAATTSSFLAQAVVQDILKSDILPAGSLQFLTGKSPQLLDYIDEQDVVSFMGSSENGRHLRQNSNLLAKAIPFNMQTGASNAIVLGEDVKPNSPDFKVFIREIVREIVSKCGQKGTAIRRVLIPQNYTEVVIGYLSAGLDKIIIGNPSHEKVQMGSLASLEDVQKVRRNLDQLLKTCATVYKRRDLKLVEASEDKGAFFSPQVLLASNPFEKLDVHKVEVFGPVCTLMPYKTTSEALRLVNLGRGALVSTLVSSDVDLMRSYVNATASHHGRLHILNQANVQTSTGHGAPLPLLVSGGPGRAGGGEELGGLRGLHFYMQRCALQASATTLTALTHNYQPQAQKIYTDSHPFRKYFEDLKIGETWQTHGYTITETDIINFANLSGDHFYAHVDESALEGTLFKGRVAHGYYILAKASGMFVEPKKGPVLLNYGIDICRFIKPVYPGTTIRVEITVKEKISQERKQKDDFGKGIVKWYAEVHDQNKDLLAMIEILTMVKTKA